MTQKNRGRGSVVKPQFRGVQPSDIFYQQECWTSAQKKLVKLSSYRGQGTDVFLVASPTKPAETQEPV